MGSDDEDSLAQVRCSDAGSADHVPLAHEPDVGKIGDDPIEPLCREARDVFDDDARGFDLVNDSAVLAPESAALTVESCALAGAADVLAGEPSADDVDGWKSSSCADIVVPRRIGPVFCENAQAERFTLHLPDSARTCGLLESELEPTDARKQ